MRIKLSKTWIVIIIIILIIVGYYISKSVFKSPTAGYATEKVVKGEVLQEVSETGSVQATDNIILGFKASGKVSRINVSVGDSVKKGDVLLSLDLAQLYAQLQSARAALDSAKSQYDKLINGLTPENIKTYEDAVISAKQDLNNAYDGARNTLNSAYSSMFDGYNTVVNIQTVDFLIIDSQGIAVANAKKDISDNLRDAKTYLDIANNSSNNSGIDSAVVHMLTALNNVYNDLRIVRDQCEQGIYYSQVSAADKTSLDTQKTNVNTASTSVTALQNTITSYETALKTAQDALSLKQAKPRQEDIDYAQAAVTQAQASVEALQAQINDNSLTSPVDGTITAVNAKKGEIVSPNASIINLLSSEPFQIKVAIYEQDIVNVKVGDDVKIGLVAFPKQTFDGKVLSIDPAETIIDNVVYYKVTIEFPNQPLGIRSAMTADIIIEANKKENVLRIPKNAMVQIDGVETVQVVKNGKIENVTITTGLEGNDYLEVTSGLDEGDEIVTGKK